MNNEEIGRRAVACAGWRWMPGMLVSGIGALSVGTGRVVDVSAAGSPVCRDGYGALQAVPCALPDLTDPATVGCLLALVREAWGDGGIHTQQTSSTLGMLGYWIVRRSSSAAWDDENGGDLTGERGSEAEALVAALEAAPA